jgi:hypothetical protein
MTDHGDLLRLGVNPGSGDRLDETADSAGLAARADPCRPGRFDPVTPWLASPRLSNVGLFVNVEPEPLYRQSYRPRPSRVDRRSRGATPSSTYLPRVGHSEALPAA